MISYWVKSHAEVWSPSSSWDLRVGLGGSQGSKGRAGHLVELKETVIFKTHSRRGPSLILEFTFSFHLEYDWKNVLHPKTCLDTRVDIHRWSVDPWPWFNWLKNRFDSSKLQFSIDLQNIFISDFTLLHKTINKHVWTWLRICDRIHSYVTRKIDPNRIPTVKLKIPGKAFLKYESRTSVTFKL